MFAPVTIVTVSLNSYFFVRLLVEKVREFVGPRDYEIIVVDRGSQDETLDWVQSQPDVRVQYHKQWRMNQHTHGEAAEAGVRMASVNRVVLLDSDAHLIKKTWLEATVDGLDHQHRLAGAEFHKLQANGSYTRYIHPHFMAFFQDDLENLIVLHKTRGQETDTGEEATERVLAKGYKILWQPMEWCKQFGVGHPQFPTVSGGVFHAWYVTRLQTNPPSVIRETGGVITLESYLKPLQTRLRQSYHLDY